ncbi:hypothetical protein MNV49_006295 [Pseudohyphozyma bogoriensis]|nr:hypothetical protein MNV49_006295 [Pseudohyphozyma bogoriensis]
MITGAKRYDTGDTGTRFAAIDELDSEGGASEEQKVVVLLLDGDHDIFDSSLMELGMEGGLAACQQLSSTGLAWIASQGFSKDDTSFSCYLFVNKATTSFQLARSGTLKSQDGLHHFMKGFNASEFPFVAVDTGGGQTSGKLLQFMAMFLDQGAHVLLGGLQNPLYASFISKLSTSQKSLIALVRTTGAKSPEYDSLGLATTRSFSFLFEKADNLAAMGEEEEPGTHGRESSGESRGKRERGRRGGRKHHHGPQNQHASHACNAYYILGFCASLTDPKAHCPYSHDYEFTAQELEELPQRAKRLPCKTAAKDGPEACEDGDDCLYGHHCEFSKEDCPFGGRCWFDDAGLGHAPSKKTIRKARSDRFASTNTSYSAALSAGVQKMRITT